ncbi:hypothetical protein BC828DRAFT_390904 [Blastocladiella britannica]|nr:hypothetical protein BC828DRAFT_390904 [Blastocladiella britannica]
MATLTANKATPATATLAASINNSNVIGLLRVLLVLLPPSLLSALPLGRSWDLVHYIFLELSVIALFRTLLGLPDPVRALGLVPNVAVAAAAATAPLVTAPLVTAPTRAHANATTAAARGAGAATPIADSVHDSAVAVEDDDSDEEIVDLGAPPHPLLARVDGLVAKLLDMTQMDDAAADADTWELIVDRGDAVKVWRSKVQMHQYRLLGIMDAPLCTTFDFLNDIEARPTWDEMTESTRIVQQLAPTTRIQHIKIKAIWPTSGRDLCLMSHWRQISPTRLVACTTSVLHDDAPVTDGIIRMEAQCAGQICDRVMVGGVEKTRVLQVADGDPKGWVPASILTFVATKAMPNSFVKINTLVSKLPPTNKSRYIPDEADLAAVMAPALTPRKKRRTAPAVVGGDVAAPALPTAAKVPPPPQPAALAAAPQPTTTTAESSLSSLVAGWRVGPVLKAIHRAVTVASPYAVSAMLAMMLVQRARAAGGTGNGLLGWLVRRGVGAGGQA